MLEIQPEDMSKEARLLWLDDGRMEATEKQEKVIEPEEIIGSRPGGRLDQFSYPDRSGAVIGGFI